jgi:hypothetical protein
VIPFALGQELFARIEGTKQFVVIAGGDHNDTRAAGAWGLLGRDRTLRGGAGRARAGSPVSVASVERRREHAETDRSVHSSAARRRLRTPPRRCAASRACGTGTHVRVPRTRVSASLAAPAAFTCHSRQSTGMRSRCSKRTGRPRWTSAPPSLQSRIAVGGVAHEREVSGIEAGRRRTSLPRRLPGDLSWCAD